jgi:hypothetical protein
LYYSTTLEQSIEILNTRTKAIVRVLAIALILANGCSRRNQSEKVQNPKPARTVSVPPASPGDSNGQQVDTPRVTVQGQLPQFSEYPAEPLFAEKPAVPILTTKVQRMFKSQFRFDQHERPNFAGEYKIVQWGCGSPCLSFAIANLKTGAVYDGPFESVGPDVSKPGWANSDWGLEYKVDSGLLVVKGCPKDPCGTYYLEWVGTKFNLVRIIPNELSNGEEKGHDADSKFPR